MMPLKETTPWERSNDRESIENPCKQIRNLRRTRRTATVVVDGDLRLERFDRAAADSFGLSDEHLGCTLGKLAEHLELDAEDIEWCMGYVVAEGTSLEGELELEAGRRFDVLVQPFSPVSEQPLGASLTLTDVTHLKRVHAHLKRVADAIQEFPTPFIILDEDWTIMNWNRGAELVYGYGAEEIIGESYLGLVPEEDRDSERARLEAWRDGVEIEAATADRVRKDGHTFPVRHELARVYDGARLLAAVSDRDISARVEAERRRDLLVKELDHRVKNILTIVLGILESTAAASTSVESFVPTFHDRINALAVAHRAMASGRWEGAPLRELVSQVVSPLGHRDRIRIDGDEVVLPASVVSPLGMALHELATNAVRHGALSSRKGEVSVTWTVENHEKVRIVWRESGGPAVEPPEQPGFGTRLIRTGIPYEIGGSTSLEFRPEGVWCEIEAPLGAE